jgi:hypothetical protein
MQIDERELQRRLNSSKNLVNHLELYRHSGRKGGHGNLTEEQRDVVGNLAHSIPHAKLSEVLGISIGEVSNCRTGKVGSRPATEDRRAKRGEFLEVAKDTALSRLMESLGLLTKDKMEECDAKGIASVASQLSKVYSALDKDAHETGGPAVTINVYTPPQRDEGGYKVIEA